ncbi:MAG: calcium/sodium antiporter [Lachnospiraceae bacterium]|nr:calcium/sodium antiporter [Lachnospiraceae bacterium]
MLVPVLLFIVGFACLIKGGDWFVDGAAGIAKRFNMPEILVGATVVSIGTTLPEVMVSASSAVMGHGEIAYGNAIGSIICNASLIAALTIAIRPSDVERKSLVLPTFFFFTAAVFYSAVAYFAGFFSRITGILLLLMFIIYMALTIRQAVKSDEGAVPSDAEGADKSGSKNEPIWKLILLIIVGAALIAVGADLLVDNGTIIAEALGVPESVIALTFVALGTSLPELVTAITSLAKGYGALSLGNVIGANLFNLVLVSGISCTLSPFAVPVGKKIAGIPASLVVEIPLMLAVMAFVTVPALIRGKLARIQGIILLIVYAVFCVFQFIG